MNGDFLLDTNVVIALLASDRAILKRKKRAEKFFVPSIVVGELFYGAYHSAHAQKNIAQVEVFAAANAVLNCDTETGRYYGEIKNRLRKGLASLKPCICYTGRAVTPGRRRYCVSSGRALIISSPREARCR